jgi:AGZA family xanthine/uracil permease-like MFS transporter
VLCVVGLFPLLEALLPVPAIVPVLLYIGLIIGAQAFRAVPKAHYVAVVLAVVPNAAAWASGLIDNALAAAGTNATKVGSEALNNAGVIYDGLLKLGEGAVLAGLLLGAIAAFMIDRRFYWAAGYSALAGLLASVGLIHGAKVSLDFDAVQMKIALGYFFMAAVCLAFAYMKIPERAVDPSDPADVEEAAERVAASPAAVERPAPANPVPA